MSTKDWPRLMSVSPVAVVGGEDRTALRAGLPFYAMPAHVTDGDALGEDEVFLFAPAGHQPDDGRTACVRVLTEDECRAEFERWIGAPPFEHMCDRMSESSSWRGQYKRYETQLAWCAWIECARANKLVKP